MSTTTGQGSAGGPPALLDAALRRDPARPLLTFYDDATGERTELSVATFGNWVAKTANLLHDDLAAGPGSTVSIDLPLHWQAAVWLQAAWTLGASVVPSSEADIAVISYDGEASPAAADVVALGLGPLGLPRKDAKPPDGTTLDYDREIAAHGDRFVSTAQPDPDAAALVLDGVAHSGAALAELAQRAAPLPAGARLLVTEPLHGLPSLLGGLLVPIATEVTAVLVRHLDPSRLAARIAEEGIVAAVTGRGLNGPRTPDLPVWESQPAGPGSPIP